MQTHFGWEWILFSGMATKKVGWHGTRKQTKEWEKKKMLEKKNTIQTYHTNPQIGHISTARAIMRTTMMVTVRNIELHSIDRERMALGALAQANIISRGIESINAPNEHTVNNTQKKRLTKRKWRRKQNRLLYGRREIMLCSEYVPLFSLSFCHTLFNRESESFEPLPFYAYLLVFVIFASLTIIGFYRFSIIFSPWRRSQGASFF